MLSQSACPAPVYVGIDVSKRKFDVSQYQQPKTAAKGALASKGALVGSYPNGATGFEQLLKGLPSGAHCVLEASGAYYLPLAHYLYEHQVAISVVNPLVIHRFAQMRLLRAKTDKADAKLIADFGQSQQPPLWQPLPLHLSQSQQLQTLLEGYTKQRTMLKNQREAFQHSGIDNPDLYASLERSLEQLEQEIAQLEQKLTQLAHQHQAPLLKGLLSIPGIGKKTALMLLLITRGFSRFESAKQLAAFVGLAPRVFESGSSVKGKGHICKLGNSRIRQLLYLCSWSAIKANPACKLLYERLLLKGKPKMVALVAVAHKLLRQAFAIATHNSRFDKNYHISLAP